MKAFYPPPRGHFAALWKSWEFFQLISPCLTHTELSKCGVKHTVWAGDAAFLTLVKLTEKLEDSSIPDTDLCSVFDICEPCSMSFEIRGHEVQKGKI